MKEPRNDVAAIEAECGERVYAALVLENAWNTEAVIRLRCDQDYPWRR